MPNTEREWEEVVRTKQGTVGVRMQLSSSSVVLANQKLVIIIISKTNWFFRAIIKTANETLN